MKLAKLSLSTLLAVFLGLGASAQTGVSRGTTVQYVTPDFYKFTMFPLSKVATDCTQLKKLLSNYAANKCDTERGTLYCKSILAQIQISQEIDFQSSNSMDKFVRGYKVVPFTNLPDPTVFSKRFDMSYASSYDFSLNALETSNAFHFEGNMTSVELSAESKLGIDQSYRIDSIQGDKFLKVTSMIRACALENGRISLIGNANMNISGYHPVGNIVYEIAEQTYRNAALISSREDLTNSQKNYLLGMVAGEQLKKMSSFITNPVELDEIALSLQSVLMDSSKSKFSLVVVEDGAGLGVRLLEPGFVVPKAPVQIVYKGE
ncbi:MAG: hypothetical protein H7333_03390 [Bdellovibrionales bacterium]|nr:hypothetical protein [Oligoflexia bacterium]